MLDRATILGHSAALEALDGLIRAERVPQALLFHGPAGVGKATVGMSFAAALLCELQASEACGRCTSCRQIEHGSNPDLLEVGFAIRKDRAGEKSSSVLKAPPTTKPDDLRRDIVVDQIREMNRLAGRAPRAAARRVFVVDPADSMNAAAQNAMLKTLEEPPGASTIVLIASRPHLLLPTVRSRCFALGFSALDTMTLSERLAARGMPQAEAGLRAALAAGRPGIALELDLEALREQRSTLLESLERLAAGPAALGEMNSIVGQLRPQDDAAWRAALDLVQSLVRDAARAAAHASQPGLVHVDLEQPLSRLGTRLGATRAARIVEFIDEARGLVRFNTNRTLISEALVAGIAGGPL